MQHTMLPCPSLSPGACSNSCPLSRWCHPTISPSVIPFSSCFQSFPASGSFPMSRLFEYSGLISFRIDWFDLLAVQGTLKSLLQHYSLKASVLQHSAFFMAPLSMISQLVQLLSPVQLCDPMDCSTPGFPVHHQHLELAQTHVHRFSDAIQPSYPLPSLSPTALNLSQHQFFTSGDQSMGAAASSISPSNEYSGMISLRIDWFDLLSVQRTLKSLLQHHSSKASILWCSAFFIVQLSHPYMTTGKTIALTVWTFVGKIMSLIFYYAV